MWFKAARRLVTWMFGGQYVAARTDQTLALGDQFDVPLIICAAAKRHTVRGAWRPASSLRHWKLVLPSAPQSQVAGASIAAIIVASSSGSEPAYG